MRRFALILVFTVVVASACEQPAPVEAPTESPVSTSLDAGIESTPPPRRISGDKVIPTIVHRVQPDFANCTGTYSGSPIVEALIDTEGKVVEVSVKNPVDPCIDAAALAAIRKWRFLPAEQSGEKIEFRMLFSVDINYR